MSCTSGAGGAQGDECGGVLRDVWLFLDDELDPERRAAVQQHLDDCSPCLEEAGLDAKLKQLLSRKCGGDHAPEHLRQRVVASLTQLRRTTGPDGLVTTVSSTAVSVEWEGVDADDRPPAIGGDGEPDGSSRR